VPPPARLDRRGRPTAGTGLSAGSAALTALPAGSGRLTGLFLDHLLFRLAPDLVGAVGDLLGLFVFAGLFECAGLL